ncbi:peptidoglycan-binding protein [Kocuria sp.]|uniref:peptidoglycan-binding protein n=1 Tax=Kocuria sp. TaxID=1871328 RepID=UPI0026E101FC|nr:peptidoglycan-binding protein [Kocuria sp.]MDO5618971.1 peptidoglycan-binding protein [Kocuria sp.]
MSEDITQPLKHGIKDRRVTGLRERLVRTGAASKDLDPRDVLDPTAFDDVVEGAVRAFQQNHGLVVDGVVGPETERRLNEAQYTFGDRRLYWDQDEPLRGDDVERLQDNLSLLGFYYGHITGTFDQKTHHAVVELQQSLGLETNGLVNNQTIAALARVNKKISESKAFSLRDYHRLERTSDAIRSQTIVLVPAMHTEAPVIPGGAPDHYRETAKRITTDVAVRTHELLREVGATPLLVSKEPVTDRHGTHIDVQPNIREALNSSRDSVVVVLDCDWNPSASAHGVSVFYWGDTDRDGATLSPIGQRGATLTLREIVARTGALDLGAHGRQWALLRLNSSPTFSVDLGYISNQAELDRLEDPEYRTHLANAVVVGLQRMYLQAADDMPTGTMSAADLARELAQRPQQ